MDEAIHCILTHMLGRVRSLHVVLLVKLYPILFVFNVNSNRHVRWVDDISPKPSHVATILCSFLFTFNIRRHCSIRLTSLSQSKLICISCNSEVLVLFEVNYLRDVLFNVKCVIPINQVRSMIISFSKIVSQSLISCLFNIKREFRMPGFNDFFNFISIFEFQMSEINDWS